MHVSVYFNTNNLFRKKHTLAKFVLDMSILSWGKSFLMRKFMP